MNSSNLARELMEQYEYALPFLKTDLKDIRLEASRDVRGSIDLRNGGGGTLEGSLTSDSPALSFSPAYFTGNRVTVEYKFVLGAFKPGDVVDCRIIIISNGGEVCIPVNITITSRSLVTDDGTSLSTLEDFSAYAEANLTEAARVFARKDFGDWLAALPSGVNTELYEHLKFDGNKERAVDNFLVCHGFKGPTKIFLEENYTDITIIPGQKDNINGVLNVKISEKGFVDAEIGLKNNFPWLRVITPKLTAASFDRNGGACLDYVISPTLFRNRRDMAEILIKTSTETFIHKLFVKTLPVLTVNLNRNAYVPGEMGKVIIENNTKSDMVVEIMPRHDFIRFEGKRYLIGARADIPFEVKLAPQRIGALAGADVFFVRSEVMVKTIHKDAVFTRIMEIGICQKLL